MTSNPTLTIMYQNQLVNLTGINPAIEARMLYLSKIGKQEQSEEFNIDYLQEQFAADTPEELADNIIALLSDADPEFNITEYIKEAQQRADYDIKRKQYYDNTKGIPVNVDELTPISNASHHIALSAVIEANKLIPDIFRYTNTSFKINKPAFAKFLGIALNDLDVDTEISNLKGGKYSVIRDTHRTIQALCGESSKDILKMITPDGYIKPGYRTFAQKTSRNSGLPTEGDLFGMSGWIRHSIQPKDGYALIALDWKAQEQWCAGTITQDTGLLSGYRDNQGDIYQAIADDNNLTRAIAKALQLGITYGKGLSALRIDLGEDAEVMLNAHKATYSTYWDWIENNKLVCVKNGFYKSLDGWYYFKQNGDTDGHFKHLLSNAPIQINAAGQMRKVVDLLPIDIDLITTQHDACYINCRIEDAEQVKAQVIEVMNQASMEYFGVNHYPVVEAEIFGAGYKHETYYSDKPGAFDFYKNALEIALDVDNPDEWKSLAIEAGILHIDDWRVGTPVSIPKNTPTQTKQILEFNQQYFPTDIQVITQGIIGVVGNQGTGKTHLLNHIIRELKQTYNDDKDGFIIVEHLTALTGNLAQRTGFTAYKGKNDTKIAPTLDYICSLNSLHKRMTEDVFNRRVVIIDEVSQVLRFLSAKDNDTLTGIRRHVINAFKKLLREADVIILLDADLSAANIRRIQKWRNNYNEDQSYNSVSKTYHYGRAAYRTDNYQLLVNNYRIGEGKIINILPSKAAGINLLMDNAVNMNPTFLNGNIKKDIKQYSRSIQDITDDVNYPLLPKQVLSIHGDNSSETRQKTFITNPSELSASIPFVLSSPSISTGVSIDAHPTAGHIYNTVIGIHEDGFAIAEDRVQAMMRVRNPDAAKFVYFPVKPLQISDAERNKLWNTYGEDDTEKYIREVQKANHKLKDKAYPKDWEPMDGEWMTYKDYKTAEIKKSIIGAELQTRRSIGLYSEELTFEDMDEINFLTEMRVQNDIDLLDTGNKTIALWESQGYTINFISGDDDADLVGTQLLKGYKVLASREHAVAVFNAPIINSIKFKDLKHKPQKTLDELYSMEKYRMLERFNLVDLSNWTVDAELVREVLPVELIMRINSGKMITKSLMLELMLNDLNKISEIDIKERTQAYGLTVLDYKHRFEMRKILDRASECFGYKSFPELFNNVVQLSKKELKIDADIWEQFMEYAQNTVKSINDYFCGRLGVSNTVSGAKWFNLIFSSVGLSVRKDKNDGEYWFDLNRFALVIQRETRRFCDIPLKNILQNRLVLKTSIQDEQSEVKLNQQTNIIKLVINNDRTQSNYQRKQGAYKMRPSKLTKIKPVLSEASTNILDIIKARRLRQEAECKQHNLPTPEQSTDLDCVQIL